MKFENSGFDECDKLLIMIAEVISILENKELAPTCRNNKALNLLKEIFNEKR